MLSTGSKKVSRLSSRSLVAANSLSSGIVARHSSASGRSAFISYIRLELNIMSASS